MPDESLIKDYTNGPVTRQLMSFAWPFMVSHLMQTAYNLVDMAVVGRFVGKAGLAAVGVGADIIHTYNFLALGLCNAGQVLISQYVGRKDRASVTKMVGTMFTGVLAFSLAVTGFGLVFADSILSWLHVPGQALAACRQYTLCCTAGLFFLFGYTMVSAILRGLGEAIRPMVFVAIASVLNGVLDVVLVGQGMGPLGAALATVTAQAVSFLLAVVYLWRRRDRLGFDFRRRDLIPDRHNLRLLLKLGVPMMIQSSAINLSMLFVSSRINAYGVTVAAVTGVGQKLSAIGSIVCLALSQAGATMVGQNFAARQFDRVRKILVTALLAGMSFAALLAAVVVLAPERVFAIFNRDSQVLAMSHAYSLVAVLNYFSWATRGPSTALCNGMGWPAMNLALGVLDGVVIRVGLCLLLAETFGMGVMGYWLGGALAGYAFILVMGPYFLSGRWKNRQPPVDKGR